MKKTVVDLVAGARPNFMKVAPLYHALTGSNFARPRLVHTGQHYDAEMSETFFADLMMPAPDFHLGGGGRSHAEQTGRVMTAYEKLLQADPPGWVVVVGDVNSTLACALAAKKLCLPVAHLEAGLRSGDRSMPEEINRLATDSIVDLLWTPSPDADANLQREGVSPSKIARVGNIMIDSYEMMRASIDACPIRDELKLEAAQYAVLTLHRPTNVDDRVVLTKLIGIIERICARIPLVFPMHPRTKSRIEEFGLMERVAAMPGLKLLPPISYIPFMALVSTARFAITDSGGVQEETTYLHIPCITLRATTERPVTVTLGTNRLCDPDALAGAVNKILSGDWPRGAIPEMWDGHTAARVAESLRQQLN
jgi:UDP-N-acetylglucosamine 2-epimerase (non-hydrolysing)